MTLLVLATQGSKKWWTNTVVIEVFCRKTSYRNHHVLEPKFQRHVTSTTLHLGSRFSTLCFKNIKLKIYFIVGWVLSSRDKACVQLYCKAKQTISYYLVISTKLLQQCTQSHIETETYI